MNRFKSVSVSTSTITVNGQTHVGRSIIINGKKVIIDGVEQSGDLQGEVTVNITGNVERCENVAGNINITGDCGRAKTTSGDIEAASISGDAETVSGDVTASAIHGSVRTVSGDIRGLK